MFVGCLGGLFHFVWCIRRSLVTGKIIGWVRVHKWSHVLNGFHIPLFACSRMKEVVQKCVASSTMWIIGLLSMNMASTWKRWLQLSAFVSTVIFNLHGLDPVCLYIMHSILSSFEILWSGPPGLSHLLIAGAFLRLSNMDNRAPGEQFLIVVQSRRRKGHPRDLSVKKEVLFHGKSMTSWTQTYILLLYKDV